MFRKSGIVLFPLAAGAALMLATANCANAGVRWTPEDVAPPASLEAGMSQAAEAVKEGSKEAESTAPLALTRDGAVLTALARNRSLAVEAFAPEISATQIPAARAEFDPSLLATTSYGRTANPMGNGDAAVSRSLQTNVKLSQSLPTGTEIYLSGDFSRSHASSSDPQYTGSWSAGINQALLRGAGTTVNRVTLRQAENTAASSQHELRGFTMDLIAQVENAYWELALAKETLKIRRFAVELAEEQWALNRDLIEVGKLSADAEISAKAEVASQRANLVEAEAAVKEQTIQLIRLLNPGDDFSWTSTFDLTDPVETSSVDLDANVSAELARLYRPELAQARLDLANQDLEVVRTRNGLLPRLDAFASFGRISSGDSSNGTTRYWDDGDFNNYEAGISFQFSPLNRAEKASHERAQLQQQQAEASIANLEQLLEAEVRGAVVEARKQWERIPATGEVVKSRQEELEVERERFLVGKSTNLDVLQVHQDLIQAQLDEVTARVRYIESLSALYAAEGTLLERRGVEMDSEKESQS